MTQPEERPRKQPTHAERLAAAQATNPELTKQDLHDGYAQAAAELDAHEHYEQRRTGRAPQPRDEDAAWRLANSYAEQLAEERAERAAHTKQAVERAKERAEERRRELAALRTQTKRTERIYNLHERFIKEFGKVSIHNEKMGQALFYTLLASMCKDKHVKDSWHGGRLNLRVHAWIIRPSGSGKDRGFDFVEDMAERINALHATQDPDGPQPLIRVANLSGTESMEVLLNHIKTDKHGKPDLNAEVMEIPGILAKNDLILMRECSFLFRGGSGEGRQSKREVFLQAMEGRTIEKTLIKYEGLTTHTTCKGCVAGTTRPFENMQEHVANTGLQQRALNVLERLTTEDRNKMADELKKHLYATPEQHAANEAARQRIAEEMYDTYTWFMSNEITTHNPPALAALTLDHVKTLNNRTEEELAQPVHKEIAHTFVARYPDHAKTLSHYNAALRRSNKIEEVDVDRAIKYLTETYDELVTWVEDAVGVSKESRQEHAELKRALTNIFKKNKLQTRAELVKALRAEMNKSQSWAYETIKEQTGKLLQEHEKGVYSHKE